MFDNILYQSAPKLLSEDISRGTLPPSILFSGPEASGKLSCALELARVLSCKKGGEWSCTCSNCAKNKALVNQSLLLLGSGNRTLEISAAATTLRWEASDNTSHTEAARFLYIRAVRKLIMRFNSVLWQGDDKLAKFSPLLETIEESLEELSPNRTLPENDELEKIVSTIQGASEKLESSFLYDSIPVLQIRNISSWAHLSVSNGKKIIIIENAEKMIDSSRNALLKILEEPPADTLFILTTAKRSSLLPTILSRVRTYSFFQRTKEQQQEVISRVFHNRASSPDSIHDFLQSYLPISPDAIKKSALDYYSTLAEGHFPDIPQIVKTCGNFAPRTLCEIFFKNLIEIQKPLFSFPLGTIASTELLHEIRRVYTEITTYNINPASGLEDLSRSFMFVSSKYPNVLKTPLKEAIS